ncbi:glycosyltransferase family 8 protein [Prevotella sp. PINT]|jgi:Lipopolysaccharide biosynthesis proteins, LPS:glycosyltransferases|uniref:glycosyltransferase family 8 protein n=1 Tax=Palleniella intestinalis TaxID=2736291 RepID=UPI0015571C36|nr:glycosyltransferase family 8 protein [Palleniella intestinalis]NPD81352.1 glycosyltransferase family 8 protein [Palleniella intestinalis]
MNIALCTDENFSIPALVCITSILENNKNEDCHIYVLTDGLSNSALAKFSRLASVYNQKIDVLEIDNQRFDGLAVSERYPVSMYYRFLLPEMLPEENTVLYLDCDIIVRGSLKELFATDISEYSLGVVVSQSCDWVKWQNTLRLTTPFFNSGVMLMNLDYWRKNNVFDSLVKWVAESKTDMWLPDQYALNKVLEGTVLYLDYTYNFQERWTRNLEGSDMHFSRWNDIYNVGRNPIVVHYCDAVKPWFKESKHKFKDDFIYYATKHDFIGFKPITRYGIAYKLSIFIDKIGLKFCWFAEKWQKEIIKKVKIS